MKVLLTGGTGFIGLNILEALQAKGHEVSLLMRDSANQTYSKGFNTQVHIGELSDIDAVNKAMLGQDAVIHTAGNTSCFARDYDALYQVNVLGTKNIVDAAIKQGVSRLVYTSTTSTIGSSIGDRRIEDESVSLTGFRARSPYGQTKILAEQEVLRAHQQGIHAIILNPAEVIGKYDHNFQWGRLVMAVAANQVPFLPPGGASFCSASSVANAHVNALTQGESGQRYILAGDNKDYVTMLDTIAKGLDKGFDQPQSNYRMLMAWSWIKDKFFPLLGRDFSVEPYRMRVFSKHFFYSDSKAQSAIAYQPTSLEDMIRDCIDWYQEKNFVPK